MDSNFLGKDQFIWWKGVVEDRKDPIMLGRVKVRIFGWHSEDPQQIPTEDLPWASVSTPSDTGRNPVGLKEGDWVWGFFMDGSEAQQPIVVGMIPGIDEKPKAPELGFGDPTKPEDITPDSFPRPPDISAQATEPEESSTSSDSSGSTGQKMGRFFNTDKVPGSNIAFGELSKYYDPLKCKFDINSDGVFDAKDAMIMVTASLNVFGQRVFSGLSQISSLTGNWMNKFLDKFGNIKLTPDAAPPSPTTSPYPLADRLMEPTTSRLARNEKIEDTIVGVKKGMASSITTAAYEDGGVGDQQTTAPQDFEEPETPYDAKYPFNHVYESESGHFIEVDDTPGAERLHWYHRSGTFREIHPDGTQVTKVKKADYNFVVEDYFCASEKTLNLSAQQDLKMKGDTAVVIQSGSSFNRQVGENDNLSVEGDENARVKGTTHKLIEEEMWTHVESGAYFCVKSGDLHIRAKGSGKIFIDADGPMQLTSLDSIKMKAPHILMDADHPIQLTSKDSIKLCAPTTTMQGPNGGLTDINMVSISIRTLFLRAHTALISAYVYPTPFLPPFAFPSGTRTNIIEPNKADNQDWYNDSAETASKKYGFVLPDAPDGTVWKPVSDSTGNLVTLGGTSEHKLYEAVPTGQLEPVKIAYEHPDGQRTEWEVVRPIHIAGQEITSILGAPEAMTNFLDGRLMRRWPAPGKAYPKQLLLDVGGGILNFILDSAVRHQASLTGFTDDTLNFDVTKPGPEAGKEESGTASPKYGYLFPKGTAGDVYKPTSDSNGNLVTLSEAGDVHELYEAIETDAKETVKIKYLNVSQTITEWVVTRPVCKRGKLIESPAIRTMFEDGKRFMCRFSKPGSEYPKNMFWVIKKGGVIVSEHFIIQSGGRHQYTIAYDQRVAKTASNTDTSTQATTKTKPDIKSRRKRRQATVANTTATKPKSNPRIKNPYYKS